MLTMMPLRPWLETKPFLRFALNQERTFGCVFLLPVCWAVLGLRYNPVFSMAAGG